MPSFLSGGKPVRIDHYSPARTSSAPAVLLVHGSGGPLAGIDPYAPQAAAFGVHVFIVHFFDRTGHSWVYPSQVEEHFPDWLETVKDALAFVRAQPGVNPHQVALLGFSLGAYLSLSLAAQDGRIAAVAELFGGLPDHFLADAAKLPPVLILHGEQDQVVPVAEAYKLERILREHGIPYEIKIYPDQGHVFRGLAQLDAMRQVASFFRRQLQLAA